MPEINPFSPPPGMAPPSGTPAGPPPLPQAAPPPPPPPSAAPDRFTTSETQENGRVTRFSRDNYTGAQTKDSRGQNMVAVHQDITPQGQVSSFNAVLPQGKLLPDDLQVRGNAQGQVEANFANKPDQKFQGQRLPDGTVLIQVDPQRPLVMMNTETLDYGLATPRVQNGPNSEWQALRELVHADNSSTVIAGEQTTRTQAPMGPPQMYGQQPQQPGVVTDTQFLQFDEKNGQVAGKKVQLHVMPGQPQGPSAQMQVASFLMLGPLGPLLSRAWSGAGGSGMRETPLMVQKSPDGTLTPHAAPQGSAGIGSNFTTAGVVDTYKQFFTNPAGYIKNFWGFGKPQQQQAPPQQQNDPSLQPVKPFSAYGVLAVWPGFANAPAPVATAMGSVGA